MLNSARVRRPLFSPLRLSLLLITVAVALLGASIILLALVPPTPFPIPLHATLAIGVDQSGEYAKLFLTPLTGLIILVVNTLLAFTVGRNERWLAVILLGLTLFYQLLVFAAAVTLVRLNL
ncbi:MAG: hypothetical protein HY459_00665 [Parcubacteria group bacterium]|nr:hypothetical protein [Parcubacteria group bacterium]